jgi:hypothetical protein
MCVPHISPPHHDFARVVDVSPLGHIPVYSHKRILSLPPMLMPYSFCFCDTLQYLRLDPRYLHTKFNIVTNIAIYSFRDIPSPWPSHMLQHWMKSHRVGPEYLSVTRKNKSRSWCIHLNLLHWKPKRHLFSHHFTEWRLMQSKLPPEIVIKYDLTV